MTIWEKLMLRRMLFASTPVLPDLGGGEAAIDDGGAGGAADEGSAEVAEAEPVEEGVEAEEPSEAIEGEEGERSAGAKPRSPEQLSKAVEKSLSELQKTAPEIAKVLRSEHFQVRQFKQEFQTPALAREARQTLESLGGPEGIQQLQGEVSDYSTELAQMAEGNPQAIEDLARDFPKGLVKLTPVALDRMRQIDPASYERTVSRHMATAMAEKGFTHGVDRLLELIGDGKVDRAGALAQELRNWIANAEKYGKEVPTQNNSEEMSEVERARQEVQTEKHQIRSQQIGQAVTRSMNSEIGKHLNPLTKGKNLSKGQLGRVEKNIFDEIARHFQGNRGYQNTLKSMLENKSVQEIDRWNAAEVGRVAQRIVRQVWAESGFAGGKPRAKAAAGNGAGAARTIVGTKPKAEDIDWTKDRSRMRYMSGEATMRDGTIRRWDRNAL